MRAPRLESERSRCSSNPALRLASVTRRWQTPVMAIPDSILKAWARQGAIEDRRRLMRQSERPSMIIPGPRSSRTACTFRVLYRNGTNIRGDSDVDIVAELESSFLPDLSAVSTSEEAAFHAAHSDAGHGWSDFRQHVLIALIAWFGAAAIRKGAKAITVLGTGNRLKADILVCQQKAHLCPIPVDCLPNTWTELSSRKASQGDGSTTSRSSTTRTERGRTRSATIRRASDGSRGGRPVLARV